MPIAKDRFGCSAQWVRIASHGHDKLVEDMPLPLPQPLGRLPWALAPCFEAEGPVEDCAAGDADEDLATAGWSGFGCEVLGTDPAARAGDDVVVMVAGEAA